MKKAALVVIVLLLSASAWAQTMPDGLEYSVGYRGVTITKYTGNATLLAIPGEIENLPVTAIEQFAFFDCSSLVSITIPSSVTRIETFAFWGCSSLTSISIPFLVTSIGVMAFSSCSSLASINVDSANPAFASVDGVLFDKALQTVIAYPAGKYDGTYDIPSSVKSIGNGAFYGCSNLISISMSSSVTTIEYAAFAMCKGLISITIPYSVTFIAEGVFSGCTSLTSIAVDWLNPAYTSVDGVLYDKAIQTIIAYPAAKHYETYVFPSSVTAIEGWAFSECSSLTNITIPSSIMSIGNGAFVNCGNLADVTIPSSVTIIENYTFGGCSSLTSITIPSSVTSIGQQAFDNCSSLTSVTLSRRTQVGRGAFPESVQRVYRD